MLGYIFSWDHWGFFFCLLGQLLPQVSTFAGSFERGLSLGGQCTQINPVPLPGTWVPKYQVQEPLFGTRLARENHTLRAQLPEHTHPIDMEVTKWEMKCKRSVSRRKLKRRQNSFSWKQDFLDVGNLCWFSAYTSVGHWALRLTTKTVTLPTAQELSTIYLPCVQIVPLWSEAPRPRTSRSLACKNTWWADDYLSSLPLTVPVLSSLTWSV